MPVEPYYGEIMLVPYNFVPRGWYECDGSDKDIATNTVLFSILGTIYGGNGRTNFKVPDMRGRVPIHHNQANPLGHKNGHEDVTLDISTTPSHTHPIQAVNVAADTNVPTGNILAAGGPRSEVPYVPLGTHQTVGTVEHVTTRAGGGEAHENRQPSLGLRYVIANNGLYPSRGLAEGEELSPEEIEAAALAEAQLEGDAAKAAEAKEATEAGAPGDASDAFLGEIRLMPYNFAPQSWQACQGQLLPIDSNQALYSLLGTTFGGDGRKNFALPDLRGRVAIGLGNGGGASYAIGDKVGFEEVQLQTNEIPSHDHDLLLAQTSATTTDPTGNMLASLANLYGSENPANEFNANSIGNNAPGGVAHPNMMPFLTLQYCICLSGVFPSRN